MEKKGLEHGDIKQVADMTGYSYSMARAVLKGRRRNDTITLAANELRKNREDLAKKFKR